MAKTNQNTAQVTEVAGSNASSVEGAEVKKTYDGEALLTELKTKSAVIRFLNKEGLKNAEIAKILGIRYQFVRNVLNQIPKKG